MPISIVSDRPKVIACAAELLRSRPELAAADAAREALMATFGLHEGDGIFGDCEAALCMGYRDRDPEENLMEEIVADVAEEVASVAAPAGPGSHR